MGIERSTSNPNATAIQASQLESYIFTLEKMVVSLARFDDDGRAAAATDALKAAISALKDAPYDSESLAALKAEEAAANAPASPGVDNESGDPLPPFKPMPFPTSLGE